MPIKNTIENVAAMIGELSQTGCHKCTLYVYRQQLRLSNSKELPKDCKIITTLDYRDLHTGLKAWKWNLIQGSILTFIQKGYLK